MRESKIFFPDDFLWGVATSAYQIEGAYNEDGKCESIWDRFAHTSGKIYQNHNGDVACDYYHRFKDDIKLMKDFGIKAYRFSISWPRIFLDGKKEINQKGLDFYNRVVDELLKNNIKPFITLYHWDLPQVLEDTGGWTNKDTAKYFCDYTKIVVSALADRVENWITFNEGEVFVRNGYMSGYHAPGKKYNKKIVHQIIYNVLYAHGLAVNKIRDIDEDLIVGITHAPHTILPADEFTANINILKKIYSFYNDEWFAPIFLGKYPDRLLKKLGDASPDIKDDELRIISTPIDFLGLNIYSGRRVKAISENEYKEVTHPDDTKKTAFGWAITPEAMYLGVKILNELYKPAAIYITENGASFNDTKADDGKIYDYNRISFLKNYLVQLNKAIKEVGKVKGYFLWSFMDNFEWAEGYKQRFGIVYIDYNDNLKRIPKESAFWYKNIIEKSSLQI